MSSEFYAETKIGKAIERRFREEAVVRQGLAVSDTYDEKIEDESETVVVGLKDSVTLTKVVARIVRDLERDYGGKVVINSSAYKNHIQVYIKDEADSDE